VPDGEQVDVDVAALGVSSVVRRSGGEYDLIGPLGTAIGVVSLHVEPEGTSLSATLNEEAGTLGWSSDALNGGCGDQSALLAVRGVSTGEWAQVDGAESVPLDECGDALKVAATVAEAEGIVVPLGAGLQPEAPTAGPPQTPQMMQCGGGSNWVYGSSCSRCFSQMKMVVGGSGEMTLSCDPGWTWTACSWSSC
jgi:hypothetical protein